MTDLSLEARCIERQEKRIAALKAELAEANTYIAALRRVAGAAYEELRASMEGGKSDSHGSYRDLLCADIADVLAGKIERPATVHTCCGCSCDVCKGGHAAGAHTSGCNDRFELRSRGVAP